MVMMNLNVPRIVQAPRGAHVLGRLGAAAVEALRRWSHPMAPDRAHDAAEVRALAHTYDDTDPRLAADLYAAADHDDAQRGV